MKRRALCAMAALASAAASCQALLGIDTDVNVIDETDATIAGDSGADVLIANPDAADASDADADPCPVTTGGVQVLVPDDAGYCIDRTEVTVRAYREFLSKKGGNTGGQRADCAAVNTSFELTGGATPDAAFDDYPMVQIDFCDALAFCDWAGKRLCGARDGGAVPPDAAADPEVDEWYRACTHNKDGLHRYPYGGDVVDYAKCNSNGRPEPVAVAPVGSLPACEGGYTGIFDMAGNVSELEDMCFVGDGGIRCQSRGGNFRNGYDDSSKCTDINLAPLMMASSDNIGFRCCSR